MQMKCKLQAPSPPRMSEKCQAERLWVGKPTVLFFLLGYSQYRFHGTKELSTFLDISLHRAQIPNLKYLPTAHREDFKKRKTESVLFENFLRKVFPELNMGCPPCDAVEPVHAEGGQLFVACVMAGAHFMESWTRGPMGKVPATLRFW